MPVSVCICYVSRAPKAPYKRHAPIITWLQGVTNARPGPWCTAPPVVAECAGLCYPHGRVSHLFVLGSCRSCRLRQLGDGSACRYAAHGGAGRPDLHPAGIEISGPSVRDLPHAAAGRSPAPSLAQSAVDASERQPAEPHPLSLLRP